jgi:basic membrane protein A
VGYSTSGGFVDDIVEQLDELKQQIIDGEISVPTAP